jgi:hypothetical protein
VGWGGARQRGFLRRLNSMAGRRRRYPSPWPYPSPCFVRVNGLIRVNNQSQWPSVAKGGLHEVYQDAAQGDQAPVEARARPQQLPGVCVRV